MYSHDTYGLGHLRRSFLLAGGLTATPEVDSVLITTGSPRAQAFAVPDGCDTVKLPALTKGSGGAYEPRTLGLPLADTLRIRAELIQGAFDSYRPQVVMVDHSPVGANGELWPLFRRLRHAAARPHMVLGLRDIIDDAGSVAAEWSRLDAWQALDQIYDRILVYGDPAILTTAQELGLERRFPGKVRFTGYLTRPLPTPEPGPTVEPTILVTVGGGGDGIAVLDAYAEYLAGMGDDPGFRTVIVTGPFLDEDRRAQLTARLDCIEAPLEVVGFLEGLETHLASAAGVIAMGGYNTVTELLRSPARVMVVPRSRPRLEQTIRAQRLAATAGFEVADAATCTPERIGSFVTRTLAASGPRRTRLPLRLDGQVEAAAQVGSLLATPRRVTTVPTAEPSPVEEAAHVAVG